MACERRSHECKAITRVLAEPDPAPLRLFAADAGAFASPLEARLATLGKIPLRDPEIVPLVGAYRAKVSARIDYLRAADAEVKPLLESFSGTLRSAGRLPLEPSEWEPSLKVLGTTLFSENEDGKALALLYERLVTPEADATLGEHVRSSIEALERVTLKDPDAEKALRDVTDKLRLLEPTLLPIKLKAQDVFDRTSRALKALKAQNEAVEEAKEAASKLKAACAGR